MKKQLSMKNKSQKSASIQPRADLSLGYLPTPNPPWVKQQKLSDVQQIANLVVVPAFAGARPTAAATFGAQTRSLEKAEKAEERCI